MTTDHPLLHGMRVLVTGASGFTGSVLVRKLIAAGADVRAITRSASRVETLADLPIRWYRGHVFDEPVVKEAVRGVDYIFHLATGYREARQSDNYFHKVHVISTQLLAQAAVQNTGFKRFVHVSTVGVHGHIENPPADETAPFAPGDIYQETKAEAEQWLRDFAPEHRLPYTVIRPAAIYGPGDQRLLKLFKMAAGPFFPILGRGKCLYHLIHVADLTSLMVLAATHPAAVNEAFICGNPEPISLVDIGRIVAREYGRKLRVVRMPAWPFFLAGAVCEAVCKPLGLEPPLYRRRVAFFTKDRSFDTSKVRDKLGYAFQFTNEEGLIQTARWYREKGWVNV